MPRFPRSARRLALALLTLALAVLPAAAQPGGGGPTNVGVTEAVEQALRPDIRMSGTVVARRMSRVASEVAGLVVELVVREGDWVGRGKPLARLRRQDLELRRAARQAELEEAEARQQLARRNLARFRQLFDDEVISRQELDNATSELAAWTGRSDSLKAEIARLDDDLSRSDIEAPFAGVVVAEHTQVGEWVGVGDTVVELMDLAELEVVVEVPERHFAQIARGEPARVSFESLPSLVLSGRISAVIPRADAEARTFPVKVRFANREGRVAVGMLARVELPVGASHTAVLVPKDAVLRRGDRQLVYRVGRDGAIEELEVTTGAANGAWVAVEGGIAPGDRVVTRGNERLRPGQPVAPSPVAYEPP